MIYPDKWYRPREIARLEEITNLIDAKSEQGRYNHILNLINSKQLPARNIATISSRLPHYKVKGQILIEFLETPA